MDQEVCQGQEHLCKPTNLLTELSNARQGVGPDSRTSQGKILLKCIYPTIVLQDMFMRDCRVVFDVAAATCRLFTRVCRSSRMQRMRVSRSLLVVSTASFCDPDSPTVPCTMSALVSFILRSPPCYCQPHRVRGQRVLLSLQFAYAMGQSTRGLLLIAWQLRRTLHASTASSQNVMESAHGTSTQTSQHNIFALA